MRRPDFLTTTAAIPAMAQPTLGQGTAWTLKSIPDANLQNRDPVWSATTAARDLGCMIWDTLCAADESLTHQPFQPSACRSDITGIGRSPFPLFWNLRKG